MLERGAGGRGGLAPGRAGMPGMLCVPNLGNAFALPDLQSAFGEFQGRVGEDVLPQVEMGHVDLPVCASTTTALPLVDLDYQPLATDVEQKDMFELPCVDQAETPRRSLRCQSMETASTRFCLTSLSRTAPTRSKGKHVAVRHALWLPDHHICGAKQRMTWARYR